MIYTWEMPWGEHLRIACPTAPHGDSPCLFENPHAETWIDTWIQYGETGGDPRRMLELVCAYIGASWYTDPDIDAPDSEQLAFAVGGAKLLATNEG